MTPLVKRIMIISITCFLFAGPAFSEPSAIETVQDALEDIGISMNGTIEVEIGFEDTDDADTSDITLATVEWGVDAKPVKHVSGHIVLLFEEDETDLEIDQGFIRLDGEDKCDFYAEVGRLYLPFGSYESHFISDPLTVELGETRETAMVLGYANGGFEVFGGMFNGDVNEADEEDDIIDGFTIGAVYSLHDQGAFSLSIGLAYLSNVADSDSLTDQLETENTIDSYVPGAAGFIEADWKETLFLKLEYVEASADFTAGDLSFDDDRDVKPNAFNLELAFAISSQVEAGLRYGASNDAGDFLPESLCGAVVSYTPIEHVTAAVEVQSGEFEGGEDITTATLQLALAF